MRFRLNLKSIHQQLTKENFKKAASENPKTPNAKNHEKQKLAYFRRDFH